MRCGISTACLYPENTLEALKQLADAGVQTTEVFLNTCSELDDAYLARLRDVARGAGMRIAALHPFSSMLEGFLFATSYETRRQDGFAFYRRYFEACRALDCQKLVFHGDHSRNMTFPVQRYAENFCTLAEMGREYGVVLCHENVSYCRLGEVHNVHALRPLLGEYANFVLDLKQVRRAGESLDEMLKAMAGGIRHVHISDFAPGQHSLPPGRGGFDFAALGAALARQGFEGDWIIELYREDFDALPDLLRAMEYINGLPEKARAHSPAKHHQDGNGGTR